MSKLRIVGKLSSVLWLLSCLDSHKPQLPHLPKPQPEHSPATEPAPATATQITMPRVACDEPVCFEAALTFGAGSAVTLLRRPQRARETLIRFPIQPQSSEELTAAQLRAAGIALIVARKQTSTADSYRNAGFSVLEWDTTPWPKDHKKTTFIDADTQSIRRLAVALGPQAEQRFQKWAEYRDAKVTFVWSRTRSVQPDARPRVAYLENGPGTSDGGVTTYVYLYARLAAAGVKAEWAFNGVPARSTRRHVQRQRGLCQASLSHGYHPKLPGDPPVPAG